MVVVLNKNNAELVGVIMGDGFIYLNKGKYRVGFVGHPITDKEYYEYLKVLIKTEWNKEAKSKVRLRGLRMIISSKEVCNFLVNGLGMPCGRGKSGKIVIPDLIKKDWELTKHTIRGIVNTDGSVFAVRKPGVERYPSIEITTISKNLAEELKLILEEQGFRVSKIWQFKSSLSRNIGYRFGLNGKEEVRKWINEIGFSNPYKLQRALSYI